LTIGAILTLGLLMILTAKVEWAAMFTKVQTKPMPPQIPMDWQVKSQG